MHRSASSASAIARSERSAGWVDSIHDALGVTVLQLEHHVADLERAPAATWLDERADLLSL